MPQSSVGWSYMLSVCFWPSVGHLVLKHEKAMEVTYIKQKTGETYKSKPPVCGHRKHTCTPRTRTYIYIHATASDDLSVYSWLIISCHCKSCYKRKCVCESVRARACVCECLWWSAHTYMQHHLSVYSWFIISCHCKSWRTRITLCTWFFCCFFVTTTGMVIAVPIGNENVCLLRATSILSSLAL